MFITFTGKKCSLYNDNKQIVRQFNVSNDIVNAQVSGFGNEATVAITMKNGKTILYKATGQIIRMT
jgi:hypothetical protein